MEPTARSYDRGPSTGDKPLLNLHAVIPSSRVNGPGARLVVFFQGCLRNCPGCFNPETHAFRERLVCTVEEVFSKRPGEGIEGITVSGGEPFMQSEGLMALLKAARERALTTVVYTGFTYGEILEDARLNGCLGLIDVLVDGPFEREKKETTLLARGSTNQVFHFLSGVYSIEDMYLPGRAEVSIGRDGVVTGTGFSTLSFALDSLISEGAD